LRLAPLATNEPLLVARKDRPLLDVLTCIREHTTLEAAGPAARAQQRALHEERPGDGAALRDCPEAVANTASWRSGSASR